MSKSSRKTREDRFWMYALAVILGLSLVAPLWRWVEGRRPAEDRLGVAQVEVEAGGPVRLSPAQAPALGQVGGVTSVRAGTFEAFVVNTGSGAFQAYGTSTRDGERLRYDESRGLFIAAGDEQVAFDKFSGRPATDGIEDRLRVYETLATPAGVEIYPSAASSGP